MDVSRIHSLNSLLRNKLLKAVLFNLLNVLQVSFPKLETLKLHALNAGKIWQDQVPSSFSGVKNLTSLSVVDCASIKYLMTITVAQSLVNLERLEINNCKMMQAIIISEDKDLDNNHPSKSILQNQVHFLKLVSKFLSILFFFQRFQLVMHLYLVSIVNMSNKMLIQHSY